MNTILTLLEPLIGREIRIGDQTGTVIEIHDKPPALILRAEHGPDAFQVDYLGRPQDHPKSFVSFPSFCRISHRPI